MPSTKPRDAESCPLCGQPSRHEHRPFCSQGCRDRDLLNWLGDSYRVPGPTADPDAMPGEFDGLDSER